MYKRAKAHNELDNSVTNIGVIKLIAKPRQRDNKRDKYYNYVIECQS